MANLIDTLPETVAASANLIEVTSETETQKTPKTAHYAYLDGIRAVAALYVVVHYAFLLSRTSSPVSGNIQFLTSWLFYGHFAVDVFIVLSGFCLILPVAARNMLVGGAKSFLFRRAKRILPPYYAAILFSLILLAINQGILEHHVSIPKGSLLPSLLLIQDILSTHPVPNNEPLWSVAVEFKIYFFLPLLSLFLIKNRYKGILQVLLTTFLIGYGLLFAIHVLRPSLSFFYIQHRCTWYMFLFGMGVCAGWVASQPKQRFSLRFYLATSLMPLVAIILLFLRYAGQFQVVEVATRFYLFDAFVGILTSLLLLACHQGIGLTRLLSWKPLVRIGTFAYSIYLLHYPILSLLNNLLQRRFAGSDSLVLFGFLLIVGMPLILVIGYIFFLGVERPFMKKRSVAKP